MDTCSNFIKPGGQRGLVKPLVSVICPDCHSLARIENKSFFPLVPSTISDQPCSMGTCRDKKESVKRLPKGWNNVPPKNLKFQLLILTVLEKVTALLLLLRARCYLENKTITKKRNFSKQLGNLGSTLIMSVSICPSFLVNFCKLISWHTYFYNFCCLATVCLVSSAAGVARLIWVLNSLPHLSGWKYCVDSA